MAHWKNCELEQEFPLDADCVMQEHYHAVLNVGKKKAIAQILHDLNSYSATLVNEHLMTGSYEVSFDGNNLPSGVYFYRLTSGDFSEQKKMVLVK